MKPRKPIKRVSARQSARLKEYAKVKKEWWNSWHWWSDYPKCARMGCTNAAGQSPHHMRGRIGSLLCDTRFWIPLCVGCHQWVHDNPEAARMEGLLAKHGDWGKQTP